MRRYRLLSVVLPVVVGAMLLVGAGASASTSHASGTTTLTFFGKRTSMRFVTPSGTPVSNSSPPAVGDALLVTNKLYPGTHAHHAKHWTASAAVYCVITKVVNLKTDIRARCEVNVAIGGSMLFGVFPQNFASSGVLKTFPITGGTGKYLGAKGRVKLDKHTATITFTT